MREEVGTEEVPLDGVDFKEHAVSTGRQRFTNAVPLVQAFGCAMAQVACRLTPLTFSTGFSLLGALPRNDWVYTVLGIEGT